MATSRVIFGLLFLLVAFNLEIDCKSRVGEICGKGQTGDKKPQTPNEKEDEGEAEENEDDPANDKFFYQGDILITKEEKKKLDENKEEKIGQKRDVTIFDALKWTNPQNIPYKLDSSLSEKGKNAIEAAISDFHIYTCLQFKETTDDSDYYIKFVKDNGCFSPLGAKYRGKRDFQVISIGRGCERKGKAIHEILHAVGIYHEQSRIDRDQHIKVLRDNIKDGKMRNFELREDQKNLVPLYDYSSVMHYPLNAFSKDRKTKKTLEPKGDTNGAVIGQREGFADSDIEQVRILYDCPKVTLGKRANLPTNEKVSKFFGRKKKRSSENIINKKPDDKKGGRCEAFAKMQAKQSS